jgi:hypothetical protein
MDISNNIIPRQNSHIRWRDIPSESPNQPSPQEDFYSYCIHNLEPLSSVEPMLADSENYADRFRIEPESDNEYQTDNENDTFYPDDGKYDYVAARLDDTLLGWTYTKHKNSICLSPPLTWVWVPFKINVNWYKRPLYYSVVHDGYFASNSKRYLNKVIELGASLDPNLPN